jgi:hypothetical protein
MGRYVSVCVGWLGRGSIGPTDLFSGGVDGLKGLAIDSLDELVVDEAVGELCQPTLLFPRVLNRAKAEQVAKQGQTGVDSQSSWLLILEPVGASNGS